MKLSFGAVNCTVVTAEVGVVTIAVSNTSSLKISILIGTNAVPVSTVISKLYTNPAVKFVRFCNIPQPSSIKTTKSKGGL